MKKLVTAFIATAMLVGCGGGGGGSTSTGGTYFTHAQLADDFVYRLKTDLGYDVDLVKTNTLQYNYIVVYDWDYGTYDAYDLSWYNPGESVNAYVNNHDSSFYYDLDDIGGNQYQDYYTGVVFEQSASAPKDRMTKAASSEAVVAQRLSIKLMENGLSLDQSRKVAKGMMYFVKTPKEMMTAASMDQAAKGMLANHTFTEVMNAVKAGDSSAIANIESDVAKSYNFDQEQSSNMLNLISGGAL